MFNAHYQTLVFHCWIIYIWKFKVFDLRCEILILIFVVAFAMAPPLVMPKNFKHNFVSLIVLLWIFLLL